MFSWHTDGTPGNRLQTEQYVYASAFSAIASEIGVYIDGKRMEISILIFQNEQTIGQKFLINSQRTKIERFNVEFIIYYCIYVITERLQLSVMSRHTLSCIAAHIATNELVDNINNTIFTYAIYLVLENCEISHCIVE